MNPDRSEMVYSQSSLNELCLQAGECLKSYDLPAAELKHKVDHAENRVVRLRNGLIECLRKEQAENPLRPSRWRRPLDQVNMALSLIAGVAYPGSKIHRKYVEEAHQILSEVRMEIEQLEV